MFLQPYLPAVMESLGNEIFLRIPLLFGSLLMIDIASFTNVRQKMYSISKWMIFSIIVLSDILGTQHNVDQ